ncbi:ABC transporter permease [Marinomonas epiphytica]
MSVQSPSGSWLSVNKLKKCLDSKLVRLACTLVVFALAWHSIVSVFGLPNYILPSPLRVLNVLMNDVHILFKHTLVTLQEILLGLLLGLVFGVLFALQMALFAPLRRWLLPLLIASQAIPVFALAPIFMLWLGYGMASKVVMAAIIIFFPITTCFFDGLRQTPQGYLDLARTLGATRWQELRHVRLMQALPALASGLRVAVVVAPIGAVVGEWVGSSEGLGYLMLQANARMQIDLMFAALTVLSCITVGLYFLTDFIIKKRLTWES